MIERALITATRHDEIDIDLDTGEVAASRLSYNTPRLEAVVTGTSLASFGEPTTWVTRS